MKFAPALLFLAVLWMGVARAGADEVRFSLTLNAEERTTAGLARLTSDQVAVVDAFVRRDTAARGGKVMPAADQAVSATVFSQRITAEERKTAGLLDLSAAEIAKLDALVERHQGAKLARTLLAPPSYVTRSARVVPTEKNKEREIHGSFSLSYGMGSGGYSEKSGSMVLTMTDPAKGYSISVGYSETHVKGGYGVYRDPYYDMARIAPPDEPSRP